MNKDYYVYLHKTLEGDLFYIGKGTNRRAWSKTSRSKLWHEAASEGYVVEIFKSALSNDEAITVENSLISETKGLVNRGTQSKVDFPYLVEHFAIDRESPSGISRIKGTWTGVYFSGKLGPCGRIRYEKGSCSGWSIAHRGTTVQLHRLVWQLTHGAIQESCVIDHIDGDPTNNKIENLREVSVTTNARNRKKNCRNTTGVTGVRFQANGFESKVVVDGVSKYKRFGVAKYGKDEAFRLACEWRQQMIAELNAQGAGYTERHGT